MATEIRRNPRFECTGTAGVQMDVCGTPRLASIVNLSTGGCLLVLKEPQRLLQDTVLELTFRINDQMFRVWGQVRAIRSDTRVGFQFILLSERVRRRIEDLIEQLIKDFLEGDSLAGADDRRRYPRVGCSGIASVQSAMDDVFYPAEIVNLSAGGCLMILQTPQPLLQDAMAELTFRVSDSPFLVQGRVKSIRSCSKVGFQFALMSKSIQRQLEDLVDEMIENIVKRFARHKELN